MVCANAPPQQNPAANSKRRHRKSPHRFRPLHCDRTSCTSPPAAAAFAAAAERAGKSALQQNPHRPIHRNPHHSVLPIHPSITLHQSPAPIPSNREFLSAAPPANAATAECPLILERRRRRPQILRLRVIVACPSHPKRYDSKDHRQRHRKFQQRRQCSHRESRIPAQPRRRRSTLGALSRDQSPCCCANPSARAARKGHIGRFFNCQINAETQIPPTPQSAVKSKG